MSLKRGTNIYRSLTFRLTLWYLALFSALSLAIFLFLYLRLSNDLESRIDEKLKGKAKEFEALYLSQGLKALQDEFNREANAEGVNRIFFRLIDSAGHILASSNSKGWLTIEPIKKARAGHIASRPATMTLPLERAKFKLRFLQHTLADGRIIQIGYAMREDQVLMERYREQFVTIMVLMLVCGGLVGWFLARRAMSGVERVTQTARSISKGDLSLRVPPGKEGTEIEDLASTFNEMLDKISVLVQELKQVTENIAHDLRGPLTRIRGIVETTITSDQELRAYREMGSSVVEETDRLISLINTMLDIAQTEAGLARLTLCRLDARDIIRDAYELFQPVAEDKGLVLHTNLPTDTLFVQADISRLQRAIANLLDNAIKYTPPGGQVSISAHKDTSHIIITIKDTGCGIAETELPRLFDRFYRADTSRSLPGNGLGLTQAKAIVQAHGGDIRVFSSPGQGSTFTIRLPRNETDPT